MELVEASVQAIRNRGVTDRFDPEATEALRTMLLDTAFEALPKRHQVQSVRNELAIHMIASMDIAFALVENRLRGDGDA